jgi:hypothetical protein
MYRFHTFLDASFDEHVKQHFLIHYSTSGFCSHCPDETEAMSLVVRHHLFSRED